MDHKKLISELQKRTGIDKGRINTLLKSTNEVLREQCININSVELKGIGEFVPKKRIEYIHTNKNNGKVTLYPPRIAVRFKTYD